MVMVKVNLNDQQQGCRVSMSGNIGSASAFGGMISASNINMSANMTIDNMKCEYVGYLLEDMCSKQQDGSYGCDLPSKYGPLTLTE